MKPIHLGAIDVGSNGVRVVVARTEKYERYKVLEDIRVPVRLGDDAFTSGSISEQKENQLIASFKSFKNLFQSYKIDDYMAVATSALRDAENKQKIVHDIHQATHIDLQIIDGITEARLLQGGLTFNLKPKKNEFHIALDIGGGSCEFIASMGGDITELFSLNIGTIRLLDGVKNRSVNYISRLTDKINKAFTPLNHLRDTFSREKLSRKSFIVTGGNARALNKLSRKIYHHTEKTRIELEELRGIIRTLTKLSYRERMSKMNLKPDRADVIVPAALIILRACHYFDTTVIATPRLTLRDGLIAKLCHDLSGKHE